MRNFDGEIPTCYYGEKEGGYGNQVADEQKINRQGEERSEFTRIQRKKSKGASRNLCSLLFVQLYREERLTGTTD